MSTSFTSNSRDVLLVETTGTVGGDISNMITLKKNMQICKYKIKALRRAFFAEEIEGDKAKPNLSQGAESQSSYY